jgi:hypothetical protein
MATIREQFATHQRVRGVSQADMARRVGMSRTAINNMLVLRADHTSVPRSLAILMDAYGYKVGLIPPDHSPSPSFVI